MADLALSYDPVTDPLIKTAVLQVAKRFHYFAFDYLQEAKLEHDLLSHLKVQRALQWRMNWNGRVTKIRLVRAQWRAGRTSEHFDLAILRRDSVTEKTVLASSLMARRSGCPRTNLA